MQNGSSQNLRKGATAVLPRDWATGYLDVLAKQGYREEYESAEENWQVNYEAGRFTASQILALGFKLPLLLQWNLDGNVCIPEELCFIIQQCGLHLNPSLVIPFPEDKLPNNSNLKFGNILRDLKKITPSKKRKRF
jgi:hypothetical protein